MPETRAFHNALKSANTLRETLQDNEVVDIKHPYYEAVTNLEVSLEIAEVNARKIGKFVWEDDERKKVNHAEQLLKIASDESSSQTERENAYRKALDTIGGIAYLSTEGKDEFRKNIGLIEA